jgi:hypothetical protein
MARLIGHKNVMVIDRDVLTQKNLDRQLFGESEVGLNKAKALGSKYGCEFKEMFYTFGCMDHQRSDWLMCCADNHVCRKAILRACDRFGCQTIIAANEKTSAEAYYYRREWKGTKLDPRVFYPDIETDESDDPTRPESCTGEAQQATPQLVSANVMAISLAQWLFVFWAMKRPTLNEDLSEDSFPYLLRANLSKLETFNIGAPHANNSNSND